MAKIDDLGDGSALGDLGGGVHIDDLGGGANLGQVSEEAIPNPAASVVRPLVRNVAGSVTELIFFRP